MIKDLTERLQIRGHSFMMYTKKSKIWTPSSPHSQPTNFGQTPTPLDAVNFPRYPRPGLDVSGFSTNYQLDQYTKELFSLLMHTKFTILISVIILSGKRTDFTRVDFLESLFYLWCL